MKTTTTTTNSKVAYLPTCVITTIDKPTNKLVKSIDSNGKEILIPVVETLPNPLLPNLQKAIEYCVALQNKEKTVVTIDSLTKRSNTYLDTSKKGNEKHTKDDNEYLSITEKLEKAQAELITLNETITNTMPTFINVADAMTENIEKDGVLYRNSDNAVYFLIHLMACGVTGYNLYLVKHYIIDSIDKTYQKAEKVYNSFKEEFTKHVSNDNYSIDYTILVDSMKELSNALKITISNDYTNKMDSTTKWKYADVKTLCALIVNSLKNNDDISDSFKQSKGLTVGFLKKEVFFSHVITILINKYCATSSIKKDVELLVTDNSIAELQKLRTNRAITKADKKKAEKEKADKEKAEKEKADKKKADKK